MKRRSALVWLVAALLALALGLIRLRQPPPLEAAPTPAASGAAVRAVVELAPTDVVPVRRLELTQGLAISGTLKAVDSALIKARVPGEVQGMSLREGDFVRQGQTVARIEATEFQARVRQAEQQAEAARAQVDVARRTYDNNRSLVAQGFISPTALESSQAGLAAAQANYGAAQAGAEVARKSLDDTVLRSPISGQVSQRLVQNGERVGVDTRVLEIVDLRRLELEANLSPEESLGVRPGQVALLRIEGASQPVQATVVRINPNANSGSRAVVIYLAVQSPANLRQGLFVQGVLQTQRAAGLAVPLDAVRTDRPRPYVQVIADGQVRHQDVELGPRGAYGDSPMVIVTGVSENSSVVAGSIGILRAGASVRFTKIAAQAPGS